MIPRFAFLAVLLAGSGGVAAPATPLPPQEQQSVDAFAAANASCREWSDGCVVCARQQTATFGCSTPGIACTPSKLTCLTPAPSPAPSTSKP